MSHYNCSEFLAELVIRDTSVACLPDWQTLGECDIGKLIKSKKLGVDPNIYSVEGQHLGSEYPNADVATKIVSFFEQHKREHFYKGFYTDV